MRGDDTTATDVHAALQQQQQRTCAVSSCKHGPAGLPTMGGGGGSPHVPGLPLSRRPRQARHAGVARSSGQRQPADSAGERVRHAPSRASLRDWRGRRAWRARMGPAGASASDRHDFPSGLAQRALEPRHLGGRAHWHCDRAPAADTRAAAHRGCPCISLRPRLAQAHTCQMISLSNTTERLRGSLVAARRRVSGKLAPAQQQQRQLAPS